MGDAEPISLTILVATIDAAVTNATVGRAQTFRFAVLHTSWYRAIPATTVIDTEPILVSQFMAIAHFAIPTLSIDSFRLRNATCRTVALVGRCHLNDPALIIIMMPRVNFFYLSLFFIRTGCKA
jgi:hypothetical protein